MLIVHCVCIVRVISDSVCTVWVIRHCLGSIATMRMKRWSSAGRSGLQQGPVDDDDVGDEEDGAAVVDAAGAVEGDGVDPGPAGGDAEERDAGPVELAEVLGRGLPEEGHPDDGVCPHGAAPRPDRWKYRGRAMAQRNVLDTSRFVLDKGVAWGV